MAGIQRKSQSAVLVDEGGKIITEMNEKLKTWTEYITDLFNDGRNELEDQPAISGPEITRQEVINAVKVLKSGKASGPDELPSEILKLIDEEHIDILVNLFNAVYNSGIIPEE